MADSVRKAMLPPWAQSLGALAGAFSAGVLLAAYPGMPERIETSAIKLAGVEVRLASVEAKVDRVICILQLPLGAPARPTDCVFPLSEEASP